MTTPYTSYSANLEINLIGIEPLLLGGQPLVARPRLIDPITYVNGLVAVADGLDAHWELAGQVLGPGASLVLTLSDLVDTLPRNNMFIAIRYLFIQVSSRTAGDSLHVGPNNVNGWTAWIPSGVMPCYNLIGFAVDMTDSLPVSPGSNDQLKITNAGSHNMTFSAFVGGNTA